VLGSLSFAILTLNVQKPSANSSTDDENQFANTEQMKEADFTSSTSQSFSDDDE
jgi:hypothetical protein